MTNFKVLFLLTFLGCLSISVQAQKSIRIGYIDTEYILENIPDYQEAMQQLNQKVAKWKAEAESRQKEIDLMKKQLENESVLLTKELYDERLEEISFEEAEVLNFQEKRFGPNGDVVLQQRQLMQPIQDQIYAAVQDIAERRKYDFIFDKNSDFLMLYSAERYDISDLVIRTITRADRRKQADSFEERKELREEEALDERSFEEIEREAEISSQQAKRDSLLANRRAQREADLAERKRIQDSIREAKRLENEARRQKVLDERNAKSNESQPTDSTSTKAAKTAAAATGASAGAKTGDSKEVSGTDSAKTNTDAPKEKTAAELQEERRQQKLKEREERRKELEARKQKILEQRKKAREERELKAKRADSIAKANKSGGKTEEKKEEEENEESGESNN